MMHQVKPEYCHTTTLPLESILDGLPINALTSSFVDDVVMDESASIVTGCPFMTYNGNATMEMTANKAPIFRNGRTEGVRLSGDGDVMSEQGDFCEVRDFSQMTVDG